MAHPNEYLDYAIIGLRELSSAVHIMIVASIIQFMGGLLAIPYVHRFEPPFQVYLGILVIVVSFIITLSNIYMKLLPGVDSLADYSEKYVLPAKLIRLGYGWGLLIIIIGLATPLYYVAIPLIAMGLFLLLIGILGISLALTRLGREYGEQVFMVSSMLLFLAPLIPFSGVFIGHLPVIVALNTISAAINIVAWILAYIGLQQVGKVVSEIHTLRIYGKPVGKHY